MTLPPAMLLQLTTTGLTPGYVAERLSIGVRLAVRLMVAAGGVHGAGRVYRIPSYERTAKAGKRLANPSQACGDYSHMDNNGKKWGSKTVPVQDRRTIL